MTGVQWQGRKMMRLWPPTITSGQRRMRTGPIAVPLQLMRDWSGSDGGSGTCDDVRRLLL